MNKEQLKRLEAFLQNEVDSGKLYGIALTIGDKNGELYTTEHGDIDKKSICMLCSMTKPITSIAAWILIERGVIDPMEPISKYLPGYADQKVLTEKGTEPAKREILIRDLLNMTSGIPSTITRDPFREPSSRIIQRVYRDAKAQMDAGKKVSNLDILNAMGDAPLFFQPGEHWDYGKNADVLGGVIEAASGMTLGEFFRKEIFEPLEMESAGFTVSRENIDRVPKIAQEQSDGSLKEISAQEFYGDDRELWEEPYLESGGGGAAPIMCRGVYASMEDYAKLGQMLIAGGIYKGKRILSENTVKLFSVNHLTEAQRKTLFPALYGYGYGNLMRVMIDQGEAHSPVNLGEFGWDGALGTFFSVNPEKGIYVTYMQQKIPDQITRRKILSLVYSAV